MNVKLSAVVTSYSLAASLCASAAFADDPVLQPGATVGEPTSRVAQQTAVLGQLLYDTSDPATAKAVVEFAKQEKRKRSVWVRMKRAGRN